MVKCESNRELNTPEIQVQKKMPKLKEQKYFRLEVLSWGDTMCYFN